MQQGEPLEINIVSARVIHFAVVLRVQATDLDDTSTVTIKAEPFATGDVRVLRGGVYVDIPREAFYRWLYGALDVTAIVEPLPGHRPPTYLDFDEIERTPAAQVVGLDGLATWQDGRERRVTLTVDELWDELARLAA